MPGPNLKEELTKANLKPLLRDATSKQLALNRQCLGKDYNFFEENII